VGKIAGDPLYVLVVEDDLPIALMVASILADEGYEVDTAENGRLALEKIAAKEYDLILSDLRMPELDGVGLYRELERQHPDLLRRLIVITATAGDLDYQRFLAQVDVPVLEKPFSLLALHAVTHEVLSTGPPTGCTIPAAPMPP
jgi:CheY-like chemotaxis protein